METIKTSFVQEISDRECDAQLLELNDLQLALVGGGIGDPVAG